MRYRVSCCAALVLGSVFAAGPGALCGCGSKEKPKGDEQVPTAEGRATSRELLTKVGTARGLQAKNKDVPLPSTSVKWRYVVPVDAENAVVGGELPGEMIALRTEDAGRTWTTLRQLVDGGALITYSVGADKTVVMAAAHRQIPKKLVKDEVPPIDGITLYFQTSDKLSAASTIFAPPPPTKEPAPGTPTPPPPPPGQEKPPEITIPKGFGQQAVLSKELSSFAVQRGKDYGIVYGVPPSVAIPDGRPLPAGETPVFASYGRPPVLLTMNNKDLLARPWPMPADALATPKPVDYVKLTKTLPDELAQGPECEYRGWSFRRIAQPKAPAAPTTSGPRDVHCTPPPAPPPAPPALSPSGGPGALPDMATYVLGVSKDKQVLIALPDTVDNTKPMACSDTFITVEAQDPNANCEPALVTCSFDKGCQPPSNHAFFRPWADKHDRAIAATSWTKGIVAAQTMQNSKQWTYLISESNTLGQKYDDERIVMDGKSERGRLQIGAMIGFGDRTLMLLSADVTGTTSRAWYLMASDDGGETWGPP